MHSLRYPFKTWIHSFEYLSVILSPLVPDCLGMMKAEFRSKCLEAQDTEKITTLFGTPAGILVYCKEQEELQE